MLTRLRVSGRAASSLIAFCFLLASCAQKVTPPKLTLENPLSYLELPSDPQFQSSYARYQKGEIRKARTEFEKRIQKNPKHHPSYVAIAYTFLAEGDTASAERYLRKSLELAPDYAQAHFALAYIFEVRQDFDGALSELNEVARMQPEYPSVHQVRNLTKLKATEKHLSEGKSLVEINPQEAIRHLKSAMDLAPDLPEPPRMIAEIFLRQNQCNEAVPYLEIADDKAGDDPVIKSQLGKCLVEVQNYDSALITYQELLILKPDDTDVRTRLDEVRKLIFIRNLPQEYHAIAVTQEITRSQFAAYLILNLEFLQKYGAKEAKIIVDTLDHWAHPFILQAVNLGIMDLFPNRSFQPNLQITKLELAKAASRILEILELNEHKVLPQGPGLENIPDIPDNNIYYPMISKALSAGTLSLDADGRFHPARSVSGAEIISVVNRLKNLAESS